MSPQLKWALQLTPLKRRIAYGGFFALAFLIALIRTFPAVALKERLIIEAAQQGWQMQMKEIEPAGLLGIRASGFLLESSRGDMIRLSLEELYASVSVLPLLIGRQGMSFEAQVGEGKIRGGVEQSDTRIRFKAKLDGVNLAKAGIIRKLDLGGIVKGNLDMTFDSKEPAKSAGDLSLGIEQAAINGGEVPIPNMGGLPVPKTALGTLTAAAAIKEGKIRVDKFELRGGDLEGNTDNLSITLDPTLAYSRIFGKARFKVNDAFWTKSGTAAFKGLLEMALANAKGSGGYYTYQLQGSLSGPTAQPMAGQ